MGVRPELPRGTLGGGPDRGACREEGPMEPLKSVDQLCVLQGMDARMLAARAGLDEGRALAIVLGRWTPSPEERDRVAAVFGLKRQEIAWGHKTPIQHIYGHGPA
jgi:hypothetical protein